MPRAAAVELDVDPAADDVGGTVALDVTITRPLRVLWLHGRDLTVSAVRVRDAAGTLRPARLVDDPTAPGEHSDGQGDLVGVAVDEPLLPGPAQLELTWRAPWGERGGLMRSTDGPPLAVTDLSPADARSLVPCFDDPRFKIPWTLSLVVPHRLAAFANYPETARDPIDDARDRVRFAPTRPLPPHLVAFAVGELVAVDAGATPVPMRVLTVPGTEAQVAHAAAQLAGLATAIAEYVDEPVPFPKLDVVAVPALSDEVVGMENPGLITVRADSLLVGPASPPWLTTAVTSTLAHELSHLWFGDLVSLAWWDEFWLNEGFATWLTDKLMAAREPTWSLVGHPFAPWLLMASDRPGGRPVRAGVHVPADYPAILDIRPYVRGAAVVALLEAWAGPESFRALVRRWLDDHRDGSVTTADLATALATATGVDSATAAGALAGLVDHAGVPVVRVAPECPPDGPPALAITADHGPADAPWPLPVCARLDGGAVRCAVVRGAASIALPPGACPRVVVPNPGARGYLRPLLAPGLLAAALAPGAASRDERAMLTRAVTDADPPRSLADRLAMATTCDVDDLGWCRGQLEPLVTALVTSRRRPALRARLTALYAGAPVGFGVGQGRARQAAAQRAALLASLGDRAHAAAAKAALAPVLAGDEQDVGYAATVLTAAAAGDARLWRRYLAHLTASDRLAPTVATGLGGFTDKGARARLLRLVADHRVDARLRARVLTAAFSNPALRDHRHALATAAAPHLTATELAATLASWCGADDDAVATRLLTARGADDSQRVHVSVRLLACSQRTAAFAAEAEQLAP